MAELVPNKRQRKLLKYLSIRKATSCSSKIEGDVPIRASLEPFFFTIGFHTYEVLRQIFAPVLWLLFGVVGYLSVKAMAVVKRTAVLFSGWMAALKNLLHKAKRGVLLLRHALHKTKGKSNAYRTHAVKSVLRKGIARNRALLASCLNHLGPVLGVGLVLLTMRFVNTNMFAVSISYNDVPFGYVQNEAVIEQAEQIVQSRMVYLNDSERMSLSPRYELTIVKPEQVLNEFELADKIIVSSSDDILPAEGLYVDGQFYGAVDQEGRLQEQLDELLEQNKPEAEDAEVSFVNDVQIMPGLYFTKNITETENLTEQLLNKSPEQIEPALGSEGSESSENSGDPKDSEETESSEDVSESTSESSEGSSNPDEEPEQSEDQGGELSERPNQEPAPEERPVLEVQVVQEKTFVEEIPFEQEIEENANYPASYLKVTQSGKVGEKQIIAKVTTIDGKEIAREVLNEITVSEPVVQKLVKGVGAAVNDSIPGSVGNGIVPTLIWPMENPSISSPFGQRSRGYHQGLDVVAKDGGTYGQSVLACADGVVTFTGYSGNYGYLVKVDHGDGVQTWYGHNSKISAKVGDIVSQGDTLAEAGSTGRSTGPHIHLEIQINGQRMNPAKYLP